MRGLCYQECAPEERARSSGMVQNMGGLLYRESVPIALPNFACEVCRHANPTARVVYLQASELTAFSLILDQEISPFGLRSMVVEPGHFRTDLINNSNNHEPRISDYNPMTELVFKALKCTLSSIVPCREVN